MKKLILLAITCMLALLILGCGGGGGGDGDGDGDGDTLIDDQLVAVWYLVSVTENSVIKPLADVFGWQAGWTSQTLEYKDDGSVIRRSYTGSTLASTENGTWTAENQAGSMTFGGNVTNINYFTFWDEGEPWFYECTFSSNGHTYVADYIKDVQFIKHGDSMVRTWVMMRTGSPSGVQINGVDASVAEYFNMAADSDAIAYQVIADGTIVIHEMKGNIEISRKTGTWSTGGATFQIVVDGKTIKGYQTAGGWLFNDTDIPATVKFNLQTWAPGGDRIQDLIGKWQASSATVDGSPVALADFFEWESGVTSLITEFWIDGTAESRNYKDSTMNAVELGDWRVESGQLYMMMEQVMVGQYSLNGNSLTFTMDDSGSTIVLTFTKI
jgi:hypothetical protein